MFAVGFLIGLITMVLFLVLNWILRRDVFSTPVTLWGGALKSLTIALLALVIIKITQPASQNDIFWALGDSAGLMLGFTMHNAARFRHKRKAPQQHGRRALEEPSNVDVSPPPEGEYETYPH